MTLRVPRDVAADYLKHEIMEWFAEHADSGTAQDVRIQPVSPNQREPTDMLQDESTIPRVPWYKGGVSGVRLDKWIKYNYHMLREVFRKNPYNLPAGLYLLMMLSMLTFLFGNIISGYMDAWKEHEKRGTEGYRDWHPWLALLKGIIASLVIVWIFPLFLFPPLVANVEQQFAAHGLPIN